jgi:hypothetical protein
VLFSHLEKFYEDVQGWQADFESPGRGAVVSIILILVNATIFIVIGILREEPLPTAMLDVFFPKNPIMCLFY